MPTVYDTARDLKTAGVEVTAHINPAKLTVRMRNSIKRMLTTGIVKGSYYSHASRITDLISKDHKLSYVRQQYGYIYFRIHRAFDDSERELITEFINADTMLSKANREISRYNDWVDRYQKENLKALEMTYDLGFSNSFKIENIELRKQVQEVVSKIKSPEEIELRKQLCDKFDSSELIPIEIAI